jgi:hypothetical protein
MNAMRTVVYSAALMSGLAGITHAQDAPADATGYKAKLHQCVTQMKTDHPEMNHDARRKACRKQLGPSPTASAATAPASAPAAAPAASPKP